MFRFFVKQLNRSMLELSDLHPVMIESLLERCWNFQIRPTAANEPLGHPYHRSDIPGRPNELLNQVLSVAPRRGLDPASPTIDVPGMDLAIRTFITPPPTNLPGLMHHHAIYAYMIENTRVREVFRRVIEAFVHGERLGVLSAASQRWLWTTEELFYRDPPSYSIATTTSPVRSRVDEQRLNLFQRMFGMTLNVGPDGNKPAFVVAEHANADFVSAFDELLHEIWQGRTNFANQVGARPTDDAKIAELSERLGDMLRARRNEGTGSREEFMAGAHMSWLHATLSESNHPIVVDLRAQAPSVEERLFKIAQRVGYAAHGLSKSYFEVAEPLSRLLIYIELGTHNTQAGVQALYMPNSGLASDTDIIKTHWSLIRGKDIKAKRVMAAS